MHKAGERPRTQYVIQCLVRHMSKPTKPAFEECVAHLFIPLRNKWVRRELGRAKEGPIYDGLPVS